MIRGHRINPLTQFPHYGLILKSPGTQRVGIRKEGERRQSCLAAVAFRGSPRSQSSGLGGCQPDIIPPVHHNLCVFRQLRFQTSGIPRKTFSACSLFKPRPLLTTDGYFEVVYYWAIKSTKRDDCSSKFSESQYLNSLIALATSTNQPGSHRGILIWVIQPCTNMISDWRPVHIHPRCFAGGCNLWNHRGSCTQLAPTHQQTNADWAGWHYHWHGAWIQGTHA